MLLSHIEYRVLTITSLNTFCFFDINTVKVKLSIKKIIKKSFKNITFGFM